MKVDLSKEIVDFEGKPVILNEKETYTVGSVLSIALNTALEGDDKDTGEQRMRKYELAGNVVKNKKGSLVIDSEDMSMLKERIRKVFPIPLVYGRISEAFGDTK